MATPKRTTAFLLLLLPWIASTAAFSTSSTTPLRQNYQPVASFSGVHGPITPSTRRADFNFGAVHRRPRQWLSSSAADASTAVSNTDESNNEKNNNDACQVLLLDHLNINHQKGQHSLLKAFYFDFLQCSIDPRKYENYEAGKKTVWANIGMHQFHLPEGKPDAQVLQGEITLVYENLDGLKDRYERYLKGEECGEMGVLKESQFDVKITSSQNEKMQVTDPWGSKFQILTSSNPTYDRGADIGSQALMEGHSPSEGLAMQDLTIDVTPGSNLDGISRFYELVLGALTVERSDSSVGIAMGDRGQTLTFRYSPLEDGEEEVMHHDFSHDSSDESGDDSQPIYPSNHGPHISLYVTNLSHAYQQASELGVLYVNPRFKRRAYTEQEAIEQCMFRIIDIVDPLDENREVIVRLEHEVRAVVTKDGKKYKSCPLFEIPSTVSVP